MHGANFLSRSFAIRTYTALRYTPSVRDSYPFCALVTCALGLVGTKGRITAGREFHPAPKLFSL